jgi:hypothetical protein
MKPTIKNTLESCIEPFQQFEDCCSKNGSQQEESQLDNPSHEFVQQHYKRQHPQWAAKSGIHPPCLTTCRAPQRVACHNDKASRRPWKENGSENKRATATSPLQIVSVDQIQSMVPGQFRAFEGFALSLKFRVPHNHDDKNQPKWEPCTQSVRYLASLPKHASSVALLWDPYQLKFDALFDTISLSRPNFQVHQSWWKHLCPFEKGKKDTEPKGHQHVNYSSSFAARRYLQHQWS